MGPDHAFDSFFTHTINTPTMMASRPLTPPLTDVVPTTIKMEDLQVPFDVPSPTPSALTPASQPRSTPTPSTSSDSKAVKKRKSWGQVLPEPKTALPPRKRAKTDDEKEQRRIERVKRNRLAAHNSRERKRQEYELLQEEKDKMDADLQYCKKQMAQMKAELEFYRNKYPGETVESPVVFDPTATFTTDTPDTICPAQTSASFPSPESMDSMDSPRDSLSPETPVSFETTLDSDLTQYPAVVLCDLQCQSASSMASQSLAAIWAYLTLFHLYLQSMKNLKWKTSSTLTSSQKHLLPWNPLLASLIRSISLDRPSLATTQTHSLMVFLMALMQSSLTCRVPLAQLMLATRLSQRTTSVQDVAKPTEGMMRAGLVDGGVFGNGLTRVRLRQLGRRKGVTWLKRDTKRFVASLGRERMGCGFARRRMESSRAVTLYQ